MDAREGIQISERILTGDAALRSIADDEFGLSEAISKLSNALATMVRGDGYAIGIEGAWGSGKSTFVNFIAEQLEKTPNQHVLRFEPWLIGDKSMLIAAFFSLLASDIDEIEESSEFGSSFTPWQRRQAKRKLARAIRKYGKHVGALAAPLSRAAILDPTGKSRFAALGLVGVSWLSSLVGGAVPLDKLKSEIVEGLKELRKTYADIRFNVIIDDVDRLPPEEAVEILRMVQKVADFPCITYLICYDSNVLTEQVQRTLLVDDGRRYTEKILQEVIHVPPQEPFALRRALKAKLQRAFPAEFARMQGDRDAEIRQHLFFDVWAGEFLETPRDVVRFFDSIALNWPLLPSNSDFIDFLWLQLLKLKSHELYAWTRKYLQNVGAYRDGGRAGDTEPSEMAKSLSSLMAEHRWEKRAYISGINDFLPGVGSFVLEAPDKQKVFEFARDELEQFEAAHRLGSPSHWRQYFAFEAPSYALKDGDITAFLKACSEGVGRTKTVLGELLERRHERRGHFIDLLLDRLLDRPAGALSQVEADGMFSAFALTMDDLGSETKGIEEFGRSEVWRKAAKLLEKHSPSRFSAHISKARAINWLTYVVRDQGFAHGLPKGNRVYPEHQWLSRKELDGSIQLLTERYNKMGAKRLFALPDPLDVLFCWVQLGDDEVARKSIADASQSDAGFLNALEAMRGWQRSSDTGVTHPLRDEVIALFFDVEEAFSRLNGLSSKSGSRAVREQAAALLVDWKRSKRNHAPAGSVVDHIDLSDNG